MTLHDDDEPRTVTAMHNQVLHCRLREQVEVFTDETRSQKVAHIAANKTRG